jgi:hypothetical protein
MTLRKRENTGNGKRMHYIALCGEFALEKVMNLFKIGYRMNEYYLCLHFF